MFLKQIIHNTAGFALIESFVGFILLSSMLLLYLPGLTQLLEQYQHQSLLTAQWEIMAQLAEATPRDVKEHFVERFNSTHSVQLVDFHATDHQISAWFDNDTQLVIEIEGWQ